LVADGLVDRARHSSGPAGRGGGRRTARRRGREDGGISGLERSHLHDRVRACRDLAGRRAACRCAGACHPGLDRNDPAFTRRPLHVDYVPGRCGVAKRRRHVAAAILDELETLAQRTPSPTLHGSLVHARAVLPADGEAELLHDVALRSDPKHHPFDHARLQLGYGAWLRRHRRVSESRLPLRAARQVSGALGCVPWGERARQELRASGEQSRKPVPAARDQLSTQELQIAQMAARGMTNREIGLQLYLSP